MILYVEEKLTSLYLQVLFKLEDCSDEDKFLECFLDVPPADAQVRSPNHRHNLNSFRREIEDLYITRKLYFWLTWRSHLFRSFFLFCKENYANSLVTPKSQVWFQINPSYRIKSSHPYPTFLWDANSEKLMVSVWYADSIKLKKIKEYAEQNFDMSYFKIILLPDIGGNTGRSSLWRRGKQKLNMMIKQTEDFCFFADFLPFSTNNSRSWIRADLMPH